MAFRPAFEPDVPDYPLIIPAAKIDVEHRFEDDSFRVTLQFLVIEHDRELQSVLQAIMNGCPFTIKALARSGMPIKAPNVGANKKEAQELVEEGAAFGSW